MAESKKTIIKGKLELASIICPEIIKDSTNFLLQRIDKIGMTMLLVSLPFTYRWIKRKKNIMLFDNNLGVTKDYLKKRSLTRSMIENHEYINLNLLKAVNLQRVKDKISYKEEQQISETFIAATPASVFSRKSHSKSISSVQNDFEQNKDIVKVELAWIHSPWPDEAIEYFNSKHLSKHRKHECLIHSFDHDENIVKVWAFYKPRFWKQRKCLNIELLKNGHTRRNSIININPYSTEELYDLIIAAEKYEKQAKISEIGFWSKYKSQLHEDRKYGEAKRIYERYRRFKWLQSYLKF